MFATFCMICLLASPLPQQDPALDKEIERLSALHLPKSGSDQYRCDEWVSTINRLRQLGKEKSLSILKAYSERSTDRPYDKLMRIEMACRLLFVNAQGWEIPRLGAPLPRGVDKEAIKKYPLFPLAISEGVPFALVSGYMGSGKFGSGKQCLELCEKLELIKEDYATTGWEKAARKLVESEDFKQLHPETDRKEIIDVVMKQAEKTKK